MKREQVLKAVEAVKADSEKKKNFGQTVDLIITFKDIDMKNPKANVDLYVRLPHGRGKKVKVCALVGPELAADAKEIFDRVIVQEQFPGFTEKKVSRKLAADFDYFVAQANIMGQVASVFGRSLGVRGKMPNPKVGCVVPPKGANLKQLYEQLQSTVKVKAKGGPLVQCAVGIEQMSSDDLTENAMTVITAVLRALPNEDHNVKSVILKKTMGKPVQVV